MIITAVERQKHNQKRYSIFIDGEYAFGMSGVDMLYYKMEAGRELTEQQFEELMEDVIYTNTREQAYQYISYRARTEKELRDKLKEQGAPERILERVVELLKEYRYLDDGRYAVEYIENRMRSKKYGKSRILQELLHKGVPQEIAVSALDSLDSEDELRNAVSCLTKKAAGCTAAALSWKEQQRYTGFLLRRGYSEEIVRKAFKIYLGEDTGFYD